MLRAQLEGYVINMASEYGEFGDSELPRLCAEATGYLIALRELARHVPEAIATPFEQ